MMWQLAKVRNLCELIIIKLVCSVPYILHTMHYVAISLWTQPIILSNIQNHLSKYTHTPYNQSRSFLHDLIQSHALTDGRRFCIEYKKRDKAIDINAETIKTQNQVIGNLINLCWRSSRILMRWCSERDLERLECNAECVVFIRLHHAVLKGQIFIKHSNSSNGFYGKTERERWGGGLPMYWAPHHQTE